MKNKLFAFQDHLTESLKDPAFKKEWEESEPEYKLACLFIEKRLKNKMSQRDLAKKMNTTQTVISRIESGNANPSFNLLKRIAVALGVKLNISLS